MVRRMLPLYCLAVALAAVAGLGCGQSLPPAADPEQARASLQVGLDAWKAGSKADALLQQTPPIRFVDGDWEKGWTLKSYKLGQEKQLGQQRKCGVQLSLRGPKGESATKDVHYEIDTAPAIVILRSYE
jgi:hypothetical protein